MQNSFFLPTYLPYFFRIVTGNKQLLFLGLIMEEQHEGQIEQALDHLTLEWKLRGTFIEFITASFE